jgi:hypothetical protein
MDRDGASIAKSRRMHRIASALVMVATTSVASAASAQRPDEAIASTSPPSAWLARPMSIEAQLGAGAPLGMPGVALGYTPLSWATIAGGVGLAQGHVQGAIVPRFHQPLGETFALSIGAGASFGAAGGGGGDSLRGVFCVSCSGVTERSYALAWWGNAELSLEERRPWGLEWRVFVGGARLLNPGEGTCSTSACADSRLVMYVGLGVGWTFAL